MWRGRPSRLSTSRKNRSKLPELPRRRLPGQAGRPQLGQVAHRHPGVAGTDVREGLGDRVDLAHRHAQRRPHVADRVAHLVGVHHRDRGAALGAVALEDRVVDLEPSRRLHVEVDVGQGPAQRGEEALHQQAVADRVDPGDAEQVVDQAARPRPAGRAADAEVADHRGDVADGEEVRRVAEHPDRLQLVVEPLPDPLARRLAEPPPDRGLAPGAQGGVGRALAAELDRRPQRPGDLELREVHLTEAEVTGGVEHALVGQGAGGGEQAGGAPVAEAGVAADLLGHLVHLLAGLQEALGVAPVEVAQVHRDQAAGGVEDVGGGGVEPVGVADRVGDHDRHPREATCARGGHPGHAGGVRRRAGAGPGQAVRDHLDHQLVGADEVQPAAQHRAPEVVAAQGGRPTEVGGGPEQHPDVTPGDVLGHQRRRADRGAPLTGLVGRRDQAAQGGPPAASAGQEGHPRAAGRRGRRHPDRGARAAGGLRSRGRGSRDRHLAHRERQVDPEDRPDAAAAAALTKRTAP